MEEVNKAILVCIAFDTRNKELRCQRKTLCYHPTSMRTATLRFPGLAALSGFLACANLAGAQAAPAGSIEFVVAATPTGGRPETAPRLPVFLLSKSFTDIQKEADMETPPPDLNSFVDARDASPELKEWMKKNKTARLSGQDFVRQLTVDDISNIPEFWEAYLARNAQDVSVGFPRAKFKVADRTKNPARFDQERKEYRERVKKYLQAYQHTKEGIDLHLTAVDPAQRWAQKEAERRSVVHLRGLQLAQSKYLVAKTETDLQGRGGFVRVTPGQFWLSTLENEAVAGDARLRWDLLIEIPPGATVQIELSNINALPRTRR